MPGSSVLPLHLVDQVLLYAQGLLQNLLALMVQMFHDLLEHPLEKRNDENLFSLLPEKCEFQTKHPHHKLS